MGKKRGRRGEVTPAQHDEARALHQQCSETRWLELLEECAELGNELLLVTATQRGDAKEELRRDIRRNAEELLWCVSETRRYGAEGDMPRALSLMFDVGARATLVLSAPAAKRAKDQWLAEQKRREGKISQGQIESDETIKAIAVELVRRYHGKGMKARAAEKKVAKLVGRTDRTIRSWLKQSAVAAEANLETSGKPRQQKK